MDDSSKEPQFRDLFKESIAKVKRPVIKQIITGELNGGRKQSDIFKQDTVVHDSFTSKRTLWRSGSQTDLHDHGDNTGAIVHRSQTNDITVKLTSNNVTSHLREGKYITNN